MVSVGQVKAAPVVANKEEERRQGLGPAGARRVPFGAFAPFFRAFLGVQGFRVFRVLGNLGF